MVDNTSWRVDGQNFFLWDFISPEAKAALLALDPEVVGLRPANEPALHPPHESPETGGPRRVRRRLQSEEPARAQTHIRPKGESPGAVAGLRL